MDPSGEYTVRVQLKHFHDAFWDFFNRPRLAGVTGAELGLDCASDVFDKSARVSKGGRASAVVLGASGARGVRLP